MIIYFILFGKSVIMRRALFIYITCMQSCRLRESLTARPSFILQQSFVSEQKSRRPRF
jgi:hypothetical protein